MDWQHLLQAALVLVVRYALIWFFGIINFPFDPATLDALVGAIVAYLLSLFGIELFRQVPGVRNLIKR